jgi:hypothetical protein
LITPARISNATASASATAHVSNEKSNQFSFFNLLFSFGCLVTARSPFFLRVIRVRFLRLQESPTDTAGEVDAIVLLEFRGNTSA